jgi:predicted DNA-binding transcriptional regulator YafY
MVDYILRTSLEKHSIITIIYQRNKDITERNIKVLHINNDRIEAYCYLRQQIRIFKMDNILAASLSSDQYIH